MTEEHINKLLTIRRARVPRIVAEKAALLVIDMQEYQVSRGFALYESLNTLTPGLLDYYLERVSTLVEPNLKRLLPAGRRAGVKIVYTQYSSFDQDGRDLIRQNQAANRAAQKFFGGVVFPPLDHPGSKIIPSLAPRPEDIVVVKNTSGVFTSTRLEFILRNLGLEQALIAGVVTNMCVENAARIASDLGFDTFIIGDACAAWSRESHDSSLRSFEMVFGSVLTTDQVLEQLNEKPGGGAAGQ